MMLNYYMDEAIKEAKKAMEMGEVPIGAVIVQNGKIISRAYNMKETQSDPTAHAEILAIREACAILENWRLTQCVMYVTIEPCVMCAGAILQTRLGRLVYGADDIKAGCTGSLYNLLTDKRFNHTVDIIAGIREQECSKLVKNFFIKNRN